MKTFLLTALCALSLNASAQTFGVGATYERDSATSNTCGLESVSKAGVLGGVITKYGQFDASAFEVRVQGKRFFDSQTGVEVGYTNGFPVGVIKLSGRVAAGKVFGRGLGAPSETGYYNTYAITAALPLTKQLSVSTTARYRPERDFDEQKLYSLGVTYSVTKQLQLQGTIRHVRSTGPILNGLSTTVLYFF